MKVSELRQSDEQSEGGRSGLALLLPFIKQCLFVPFCLPVLMVITLLNASPVLAFSFDPVPLKTRAAHLLDSGDLLECVDTWNMIQTFSTRPEDRAEALVRMGDIYSLFLGQPDEALAAYGAAMRVHPALPVLENAYFNAGMILYEQERLPEARATFQTYLLRYPKADRRETALFMLERMRTETSPKVGQDALQGGEGSLQPLKGEPVLRVAIARASDLTFHLSAPVALQQGGVVLQAGSHHCAVRQGALLLDGRPAGKAASFLLAQNQRMKLGNSPAEYGGALSLLAQGGQVLVVNTLGMESYLEGVLPAEMPASFSPAALQAQTVAARSYALYLAGRSQEKAYDVAADTGFQVYGGLAMGNRQTRAAVRQTRGMALQFGGRVVLSYFHSHSGGVLEDDSQVWTADMPYYRVQHDEISNRARDMRWELVVAANDIAARMRESGFNVDGVQAVHVGRRTGSGRVGTVVIETPDRSVEMKGNAFRLMLGAERMRSTLCSMEWQGGSLVLSGVGYGHGVGMSQWGAQGMALAGATYEGILEKYYPDTRLVRLY
ncbi:SpoIID/LytB domain-containing protein [Desulfovibrio mangrovi]|uniref:SpoIID/LytB domain-containing protein n=1 Tax=Desulfovibrio mangrovi TaxID=2976983 RepID=UPI00224614C6|nr:SpoIID/LytB domain-containing protein [Desulfovibrio mangrovi]UZP68523.1 SpoIID/LytB domain-containing protein [Desulfovibrio mangrovi]